MRQTIRYRVQSMNKIRQLLCCVGALVLLGGCAPKVESIRYISLEGDADAQVLERAQGNPLQAHAFVGEIPTIYQIEREGYTLTLETYPGYLSPKMIVNVRPYPEYRIGFHNMTDRRPEPCVRWTWDKGTPGEWFFQNWCDTKDNDSDIDMHLRFTVFDQDGAVVAEEAIPYTVKWNGFYGYIDAV